MILLAGNETFALPVKKVRYGVNGRYCANFSHASCVRQSHNAESKKSSINKPIERFTPLEKVHPRRDNSLTGFTLLELLLVIAIIAIVVGLATPSLKRSINNAVFKAFVQKTYFFLDYAKTQAVCKNGMFVVTFDLEEENFFLTEKDKVDDVMFEIMIPQHAHLETDKKTILFYPDGTLEEFKITIYDDYQRQSVISSKGFNGKIVID